jgi:hypothetical protein
MPRIRPCRSSEGYTREASIAEGPTSEGSMAEGANDTLLPSLVLLRVGALDVVVVVVVVGCVVAGASWVKTGSQFRFSCG